jgi:hypothetical protein
MPEELWRRVEASTAETDAAVVVEVARELVTWAHGRNAEELEALLDGLREIGAYPVSLEVLEAAWNSDLDAGRMGRVVEDWIGTVLYGLGDVEGAREVAQHIVGDAKRLGAAFCSDLGDLLLTWDMWDVAAPLIEDSLAQLPGDQSLRFNMGVVHKFRAQWAESVACFEEVLRHRPKDRAAAWNLGIAATAMEDWSRARQAWAAVGFELPDGEGDFGAESEPTPIRLPVLNQEGVSSEVVWGLRFCPARVVVRGLPYFAKSATFGDVVLIDGVPSGETGFQGKNVPIFPALCRVVDAGNHIIRVCVTDPGTGVIDFRQLVEWLDAQGWPAANWSELPGATELAVGVVIDSERSVEELKAILEEKLVDAEWSVESMDS